VQYIRTATSVVFVDATSGKILHRITPARPLVGIVDLQGAP
jgi:hypothetical protein